MKIVFQALSIGLCTCAALAQRPVDYGNQLAAGYELGVIPNLQTLDNALNFTVIGDWGRQGEFHQREVALTVL